MLKPHDKATLIAMLELMPTTTPCSACVYFDNGMCRDAQQMIPDDVLPEGCDDFKFDENSPPF